MKTKKQRPGVFDFGRFEFGGIEVKQVGASWRLTWRLHHYLQNVEEATQMAAELLAVEHAGHGVWRVNVKLTREQMEGEP